MFHPSKLTKKSLKDTYYSLRYIVMKKRYLVPPPPRPIPNLYMIWIGMKLPIALEKEKETPRSMIWGRLSDYYSKMKDIDPQLIDLAERVSKQREQHAALKMQYHEQYIRPFKKPLNPSVYYLMVNSSTPQFKSSFQSAFSKYKELPREEKNKIMQECQQFNAKNQEKYRQFRQKHTIFQPKNYTGYKIYLKEMSPQTTNKVTSNNWKMLDPEAQKTFIDRAKMENEKQQSKYRQFLNRFKMTEQQLNYAYLISTRYQKMRKSKRQHASTQDQTESMDDENDTIDQLD